MPRHNWNTYVHMIVLSSFSSSSSSTAYSYYSLTFLLILLLVLLLFIFLPLLRLLLLSLLLFVTSPLLFLLLLLLLRLILLLLLKLVCNGFFSSLVCLHTRCCHIRAHVFALSVTMVRSSGEQGSSSIAGSRGGGPLLAVHHSRS